MFTLIIANYSRSCTQTYYLRTHGGLKLAPLTYMRVPEVHSMGLFWASVLCPELEYTTSRRTSFEGPP